MPGGVGGREPQGSPLSRFSDNFSDGPREIDVSPTRPAEFEPATLGSEDRRPDDVNPSSAKALRQGSNDVVPTLVPSSSQEDSAAILPPPTDPDLARVLAAWPRLPEAIKAGILAMVQVAGGPDA